VSTELVIGEAVDAAILGFSNMAMVTILGPDSFIFKENSKVFSAVRQPII
jgi:hypothetical protein